MTRRALVPALLTATLFLHPTGSPACSPAFPEVVFTPRGVPAVPLESFLEGEIGVLQPYFGVRHLWPAYRALSGRGLTAAERQEILAAEQPREPAGGSRPRAVAEWIRERDAIPGAGPAPAGLADAQSWDSIYRRSRKPGEWFFYVNCPEDAFRTAARTLRDRTVRAGADNAVVLGWLRAQDAVFSNCAEGRVIPEPAPADADALARADRDYQIAAAHFYTEEYDEAERRFRAIAADQASPWSDIAAYLVGRVLLRKATIPGTIGVPPDRGLLEAAERQFSSLLADPARAAVHGPAASHLRLSRAWLDRDGYIGGVAAALAVPADNPGITERLREYEFLLGEESLYEKPRPSIGDLTAWVLVVRAARAPSPTARQEALAAWERTRSLPWLVAALMNADPSNEKTASLLEAAATLPPESPAYPTAAYHRLRLLLDAGKLDEGRALATRLLESPRWSAADRNLLLAARMRAARTLEEFLADAQRLPVAVAVDGDIRPWHRERFPDWGFPDLLDGRVLLGLDAAATIRGWFPLSTLVQASRSPALPPHLRRDLAQAAFVSAFLLGDHASARGIAPELAELAPEIAGGLKKYLKARGDEEAAFAAAYLILSAPGMQPSVRGGAGRRAAADKLDRYRDNWWSNLWSYPGNGAGAAPAFSTHEELTRLDSEMKRLGALPWAPEHLGGIVLAWARAHRDDLRVPEALYLVVRATQLGASKPKSPTSRDAFRLLHQRYPDSEWAARTPYWF